MKPRTHIPEETKIEIIRYFINEHENSMRVIGEKFGYSSYLVDRIISDHYEQLKENK
jgi:hypothetical protein